MRIVTARFRNDEFRTVLLRRLSDLRAEMVETIARGVIIETYPKWVGRVEMLDDILRLIEEFEREKESDASKST